MMPTPTGLPKVGEIWELAIRIPGREVVPQRVVVLERSGGEYWSLRVANAQGRRTLWVDTSYHLQQGWLKYIAPAGPETRKRFGLPPPSRREAREVAQYRIEQAQKRRRQEEEHNAR